MLSLGIPFDKNSGYSIATSDGMFVYSFRFFESGLSHSIPAADEAFFPGRRVDVLWKSAKVGVLGIVHPEVLGNYELKHPVSGLELDLQPFLDAKLQVGVAITSAVLHR